MAAPEKSFAKAASSQRRRRADQNVAIRRRCGLHLVSQRHNLAPRRGEAVHFPVSGNQSPHLSLQN